MSCFTIDLDSEYEKQVDLLLADDEENENELNKAKLEDENKLNWSGTSILRTKNLFRPSTGINKNSILPSENEERNSINTNFTSNTLFCNNPSPIINRRKINNNCLRKFSINSLNDKIIDNFS